MFVNNKITKDGMRVVATRLSQAKKIRFHDAFRQVETMSTAAQQFVKEYLIEQGLAGKEAEAWVREYREKKVVASKTFTKVMGEMSRRATNGRMERLLAK